MEKYEGNGSLRSLIRPWPNVLLGFESASSPVALANVLGSSVVAEESLGYTVGHFFNMFEEKGWVTPYEILRWGWFLPTFWARNDVYGTVLLVVCLE